jgi:hypothetical protein
MPVIDVQFHIAGSPTAKTYRSTDPDIELDGSVAIDFQNANHDFFSWGTTHVTFTLALSSVTVSSEKPTNDNEEDYVAHGSLEASLDPDPNTKASDQAEMHVVF